MAVKKPIQSKIIGPAQTLDEKAKVLLGTINYHIIRKDSGYCKKTIEDVKWLYSKKKEKIPSEIDEYMKKVEKMLEE